MPANRMEAIEPLKIAASFILASTKRDGETKKVMSRSRLLDRKSKNKRNSPGVKVGKSTFYFCVLPWCGAKESLDGIGIGVSLRIDIGFRTFFAEMLMLQKVLHFCLFLAIFICNVCCQIWLGM